MEKLLENIGSPIVGVRRNGNTSDLSLRNDFLYSPKLFLGFHGAVMLSIQMKPINQKVMKKF